MDCLGEKGFPGTRQPDGSVLTETTPDQADQRRIAGEECMDAALEKFPLPAETEEFKRTLYAEEVETVRCLQDNGVTVSDVPSIQTYVENYAGPSRWSSWGSITPDTQPELFAGDLTKLSALQAACPDPLSLY